MWKQATMVVDYQNWFADEETNELYVNGGESIAPIINEIMQETKREWGIVIASKDMHRDWNISFAENFKWKVSITEFWPDDPRAYITLKEIENWTEENNWLEDTAWFTVEELKVYVEIMWWKVFMWPKHCWVNTKWNDYYKDLDTDLIDIEVYKWYEQNTHPYTAYPGIEVWTKRDLEQVLVDEKVDSIKVVWLATDWCVKDTAIDLAKAWKFVVELILKATKPVNPATQITALEQMREAWVKIIE
jgi:nicotinamidase-related amidase